MLEVMAERTVTVDGRSHPVPRPFLVLATQNPWTWMALHPAGGPTRPLRAMRISVGYPNPAAEIQILKNARGPPAGGPASGVER